MNTFHDRVFYFMMTIGALAIWFAMLTACGGVSLENRRYNAPYSTQAGKQSAATVGLQMQCFDFESGRVMGWRGSGIITGKHTILTADHVAQCESGLYVLTVELASGDLLDALVVVQASEYDIAKIVVQEGLPWFEFEIGPVPVSGDYVCSESANPSRMRRCGTVEYLVPGSHGADIKHRLTPVPGNSGSGLFNARGQLVGIITRTRRDGSAGFSASLWEHRAIMGASY